MFDLAVKFHDVGFYAPGYELNIIPGPNHRLTCTTPVRVFSNRETYLSFAHYQQGPNKRIYSFVMRHYHDRIAGFAFEEGGDNQSIAAPGLMASFYTLCHLTSPTNFGEFTKLLDTLGFFWKGSKTGSPLSTLHFGLLVYRPKDSNAFVLTSEGVDVSSVIAGGLVKPDVKTILKLPYPDNLEEDRIRCCSALVNLNYFQSPSLVLSRGISAQEALKNLVFLTSNPEGTINSKSSFGDALIMRIEDLIV